MGWNRDKARKGESPDDALALGKETNKSRRSYRAAGENSFRVAGTDCKACGGEDGYHENICPKLN